MWAELTFFQKKNLILLFIINLLFISNYSSISLLSKAMTINNVSIDTIGMILSIIQFSPIFFSILATKIADKLNKRKTIIVFNIIGFLIYICFSLAKGNSEITILGFLLGSYSAIGMIFIYPLSIPFIPNKYKLKLSILFLSSSAFGTFLGPMLSEIFLNYYLTQPYKLFYSCIILTVISLILLYLVDDPDKSLKETTEPVINSIEEELPLLHKYIPLISITFFFGCLYTTFFSFMSAYASENSILKTSSFFLGFGIVSVIQRVFFSGIISKLKREISLSFGIMCIVLALLFAFIFKFYATGFTLFALGLLYGTGHSILYPILSISFTDLTPKYSSKAMLIFFVCFSMGQTVSSMIFSCIVKYIGYSNSYLLIFFISIAYLLYEKKRGVIQNTLTKLHK